MANAQASASILGDDAQLQIMVAQAHALPAEAGIGKRGQALSEQFHSYKSEALPYLLPLLKDSDEHVRNFAGFVLRDQEGLTEASLAALVTAMRDGNGWIAPAIARIGTDPAVAALVSELQSHPEANTQLTYAIAEVSEHALPALAKTLKGDTAIAPEFAEVLCPVFHKTTSSLAIDVLLDVARNDNAELENRRHAITILGCTGNAARRTIPDLNALAEKKPEVFQEVAENAIIEMGTSEAVPLLVQKLHKDPGMYSMREIAWLGQRAQSAGPSLVPYLSDPDADTRLAAARTLGFIGYAKSADRLIPLLADQDDWRLVFASAESLGLFHSQRALESLQDVASHHWFPPVRDAARRAIDAIRNGNEFVPLKSVFGNDFDSYEQVSDTRPESEQLHTQPAFAKEKSRLNQRELDKLSYEREVVGYGVDGRHVKIVRVSPHCGVKVGNIYIAGRDFGEWGGELVQISGNASSKILLNTNTRDIHETPSGIVAVTGVAHMTFNHGALYRVTATAGGYVATRWKTLPGAPGRSGMLKNGKLFVASYNGNIVISPDGVIEMASDANVR